MFKQIFDSVFIKQQHCYHIQVNGTSMPACVMTEVWNTRDYIGAMTGEWTVELTALVANLSIVHLRNVLVPLAP